jgi:hypothetical protein
MWKMEFQRRGAPHFHLLAELPTEDLAEFQGWCSESWARVVGSEDPKHKAAGTNVVLAWSNCLRYFAYAFKGEADGQNTVPRDFSSPGRFWGVWNQKADWRGLVVKEREWVQVRRMLRSWAKSKGRYRCSGGVFQGEWFVTDGPAGPFFGQLLAAAAALRI